MNEDVHRCRREAITKVGFRSDWLHFSYSVKEAGNTTAKDEVSKQKDKRKDASESAIPRHVGLQ